MAVVKKLLREKIYARTMGVGKKMNIRERHMENKSVMMKHRRRENRVEEEDEELKEVKMRMLW